MEKRSLTLVAIIAVSSAICGFIIFAYFFSAPTEQDRERLIQAVELLQAVLICVGLIVGGATTWFIGQSYRAGIRDRMQLENDIRAARQRPDIVIDISAEHRGSDLYKSGVIFATITIRNLGNSPCEIQFSDALTISYVAFSNGSNSEKEVLAQAKVEDPAMYDSMLIDPGSKQDVRVALLPFSIGLHLITCVVDADSRRVSAVEEDVSISARSYGASLYIEVAELSDAVANSEQINEREASD